MDDLFDRALGGLYGADFIAEWSVMNESE